MEALAGVRTPRSLVTTFPLINPTSTTVLSSSLRLLCKEAIVVHTITFEDVEQNTGEFVVIGSKTETALLNFAKELGWPKNKETRDADENHTNGAVFK